jgi:hypothetical protein
VILVDCTDMSQSVLHESWENWLQQHEYTLVHSEDVENIEIQMFACHPTASFAVYAPISFGLIYINISTPQEALILIARLKQLLLLPWDMVQYDASSEQQQSISETFLTEEGGTMKEEVDASKTQISPHQMQNEEVIDQLSVGKLQKETDILLASLQQMAERGICPKIAWRTINVLSRYKEIVDRFLEQS